jgi:hypothetical protein
MRHSRVALAAMLGPALGACFTPSIPIPPPEAARMTFSIDATAGAATFSYGPQDSYGGAIVYVYNRTQRRGVIDTARDDGSVGPTEPFPAKLNDQVSITFETPEQVVSTCVVIKDGTPGSYCP